MNLTDPDPILEVGKLYQRKIVQNVHQEPTSLWPDKSKTTVSVGQILLGTPCMIVEHDAETGWYKALTSEGIIGWARLAPTQWIEVSA